MAVAITILGGISTDTVKVVLLSWYLVLNLNKLSTISLFTANALKGLYS